MSSVIAKILRFDLSSLKLILLSWFYEDSINNNKQKAQNFPGPKIKSGEQTEAIVILGITRR